MTDPLIQQLAEARKAAGLSQRALAKAADTAQSYLWYLESGAKNPSLSTLRKWAQALGLQPVLVPLAYETAPVALIAQAIRDEAKHYPGDDGREDRCVDDEDVCMAANIHHGWSVDGVVRAVYASPERIAEVAVAALGAPQTAAAVCCTPAANGAPRLGEGPAVDGAPASDPAVAEGGGRADVAQREWTFMWVNDSALPATPTPPVERGGAQPG
jgi:transcriptional regulator with XRE-family HTH domain